MNWASRQDPAEEPDLPLAILHLLEKREQYQRAIEEHSARIRALDKKRAEFKASLDTMTENLVDLDGDLVTLYEKYNIPERRRWKT